MRNDIIPLGPVRAGKSAIGHVLAEQIGVLQVSLDEKRWDFYREIGYDPSLHRPYAG